MKEAPPETRNAAATPATFHCHKLCVTFLPFPSLFPHTEQKQREALEKEKERLQNMDEEEYDALTEEEKVAFNREVQQALRERKKR